MHKYEYTYKWGHWVVLRDGKFWGSYDTKHEAMKEVEEEGD